VFESAELDHRITKQTYARQEPKLREALLNAQFDVAQARKFPVLILIAGVDGAGKGETVNLLNQWMDPRHIQTRAFGDSSDEELERPRMWRFWRHVPRRGRITLFDRSWYGRVLVERVEGFCGVAGWMLAYGEINDFEEQLVRGGAIVCKFWLQITAEEQLRRFTLRQKTSFKRFKITDEDWRNRRKWGEYEQAVCDVIDRTSTDIAPWTVVEAEDKYFARIKILRTIVERMQIAL
jgi:polyphosphate kinase 2 (PPK2 family)